VIVGNIMDFWTRKRVLDGHQFVAVLVVLVGVLVVIIFSIH